LKFSKKSISYGGEPQNVCNFESGLNTLAKPKSLKKTKRFSIKFQFEILVAWCFTLYIRLWSFTIR